VSHTSRTDAAAVEPATPTSRYWSLLPVLVITLLLGLKSPGGVFTVNAAALAALVFQVAGTMVALALPAAQLANGFFGQLEALLLETIRRDPGSLQALAKLASTFMIKLSYSWRATVYALVSFVLSALAMLLPSHTVEVLRWKLSIDEFTAAASLSFLLVGAALFYPTARFAFSLGQFDALKRAAEAMYRSPAVLAQSPALGGTPAPAIAQENTKQGSS